MIVLIDNYDSFTYNLYQQLKTITPAVQVIRNDAMSVSAIKQQKPDAIVLSPGPGRPEQAGVCLELVKACYTDTPILGICLGHQVIATAFGAEVIGAPDIVHGQCSLLYHNGDPVFTNTPPSFNVGRYHSLTVDSNTVRAPLRVIACTDDGTVMAIRHQQHRVVGLQFHPESLLTQYGQQCLENGISLSLENPHV